jgi:hypothetical protein
MHDALARRRILNQNEKDVARCGLIPARDLLDDPARISILIGIECHGGTMPDPRSPLCTAAEPLWITPVSSSRMQHSWRITPTDDWAAMGVTTDFIGHIRIDPPLNTVEHGYLAAFSQTRHFVRSGGPYDVALNPAAARGERSADIDAYNKAADGQPSLWCHWVPSWDGACLTFDGQEKFYGATGWMRYLIEHFLAPEAHARVSGLHWFDGFTFDHQLNGILAACPRDTHSLYLIVVENNLVREVALASSGVPSRRGSRLPYELAIDALDKRRRRPQLRSMRNP